MEKTLNKESIYELQKIDCNCNDCGFMVRDVTKYKSFNHIHTDQKAASHRLNYGDCTKFYKPVSFIPGTCQPQTQHCFIHRKDMKPKTRDEKAVDILMKYLPLLTG